MSNLTENKLNTVISAADLAIISANILAIFNKLPAGSLTEDQRKGLKAIDVANKVFVEDIILEMLISGTGIIPAFINSTFIQNDLTLFEQLDSIEANLLNLLQKIQDLKRIAGDEAYTMALAAYKIYDAAHTGGIPGAKQAIDKLRARFEAQNTAAGRPTNAPLE